MEKAAKYIIRLSFFSTLFWCFLGALFFQWWSILTMTTVGTVGTAYGCITFCPLLMLTNTIALVAAFRKKSGSIRLPLFLMVLIANGILIYTGTRTIIGTINSLSSHSSYFTPKPEDITWEEWLSLFLEFVVPAFWAVIISIGGLLMMKVGSSQPPKTELLEELYEPIDDNVEQE